MQCGWLVVLLATLVANRAEEDNPEQVFIHRLPSDTARVISSFLKRRDWAVASVIGSSFRDGMAEHIRSVLEDKCGDFITEPYWIQLCSQPEWQMRMKLRMDEACGFRGCISDGLCCSCIYCPKIEQSNLDHSRSEPVIRGVLKNQVLRRLRFAEHSECDGWIIRFRTDFLFTLRHFQMINVRSSEQRWIGHFIEARIVSHSRVLCFDVSRVSLLDWDEHKDRFYETHSWDVRIDHELMQQMKVLSEHDEGGLILVLHSRDESEVVNIHLSLTSDRINSVRICKSQMELDPHLDQVSSVLSNSGSMLVSLCKDNRVMQSRQRWSIVASHAQSGRCLFHSCLLGEPESMQVSPDGTRALFLTDGSLTSVDLRSGEMTLLKEREVFSSVEWINDEVFRLSHSAHYQCRSARNPSVMLCSGQSTDLLAARVLAPNLLFNPLCDSILLLQWETAM